VTAAGGAGGVSRNFTTAGAGTNGGSGGGAPASAGTGFGGGGGGYDGSNGSKSTNTSSGGQTIGTGQLGVAIGLGTNPFIPGGGAGGNGSSFTGIRGTLGGPYQGIYGFGAGHAGNWGGTFAEGQLGDTASGRGSGGGADSWNANGGNGAPGMIVLKKIS
jgi:hypothetical protein